MGRLLTVTLSPALAVALTLNGCSSSVDLTPKPAPSDSPSPLGCAERFEEPANYTFSYFYGAFSPFAGDYRVTVRDHVPVSFEVFDFILEDYVGTGLINLDSVLTLNDIVQLYFDASASGADWVDITWDKETCYPTSVSVDQYRDAVDDEYGYTIVDIVVD